MTAAQSYILKTYPNAHVAKTSKGFIIYSDKVLNNPKHLGSGQTEQEAWENAKKNLIKYKDLH